MQAFCQKIFNCRYKYTLKRKFVTQSEQKRQKKNGVPPYSYLVNLKSNTMKNTMQSYT